MKLVNARSNGGILPLFSMFDDFVDRFHDAKRPGSMVMDIFEKPGEFVIEANVPGIPREQIVITTDHNLLVIEARQEEERKENGELVYSERYYGSYRRSLRLPDSADMNAIKAKMDNGVLLLTVPKKENNTRKDITIE
jgi:HSP20 family protein